MTDHPEAAHAASEMDDYDAAAPEGFGIAVIFLVAAIAAIGLSAWAVFA